MQDMIPERGDTEVAIPMTFDIIAHRDNLTLQKMALGLLIIFGGLVAMILLFIFAASELKPQLPIAVFLGVFYFVRLFFLHERSYKRKQLELQERDYKFNTKVFWGIYSINEYYPYICRMANGSLGIFVAFDKDVIVGRNADADFDHYQAIAEAYSIMLKKNIWCVHIDYADTVGKDDRMDSLFKNLIETENKDLKNETLRLYDHVQVYMNRAYADYDVYAFFYRGKEEAFWDDLQPVINAFDDANYVRNRILTREEIGDLCISLMNLNDFSTTKATEQVFLQSIRGGNNIKVIWTEKDGKRTVVNRTREEIEEERRVKNAEAIMRAKQKRGKKRRKTSNIDMDANLDIFEDSDGAADSKTAVVAPVKLSKDASVLQQDDKIDMDAKLDIFDD